MIMTSTSSGSGETSPAQSITPSTTPLGTHAPKYGTVIPNRVFVGGITPDTTEEELKEFFSSFGAVTQSKIVSDRARVSKGYGFITFETQDDARNILENESENIVFKGRKLNIGPAIRKQLPSPSDQKGYTSIQPPYPRLYDPSVSPGTLLWTSYGVPYTYQNGMAFFQPPEGCPVPAQPQAAYPMVVPQQPVYVSQPYAFQSPTAAPAAQWAQSQWRWASPSPTAALSSQYMYPAVQALPPEMYAATQPPPADAAVMEATPAEGSMVMEPNMVPHHYVEGQSMVYASVAATLPTQQTPIHTSPTGTIVSAVPHRTPIAYKRPIAATASRKIMGTPSVAYSPRATPPAKVMAGQGQQRVVTKMVSSIPTTPVNSRDHTVLHDSSDVSAGGPLTPPPTPDVVSAS